MGETYDKRLERCGGIAVKQCLELCASHAADSTEVFQCLAARGRGNLHLDERLGKRRTAHLRLNAHVGQRCRKAQHLCFRQPHLLACASKALCHLHDGLLGRGKVVAQIYNGRADILEQALVRAHDVGKLGDGGRGFIRIQVLAGITQVDHDTGELRQVFIGDAQLTAGGHDSVDFAGGRSNLGGHLFGGCCQRSKLGFSSIHGLAHTGKGGLEVQGSLDRRRPQREDGCGHDRGKRSARRGHRFADRITGFSEALQRFTYRCPCGLGSCQLTIGLLDLRAGGLNGGLCPVQRSFRVEDGVGSLLDFIGIISLLCGLKLFPCATQGVLVLRDGFFLNVQLFTQQRQPGGQAFHAGVHVLDARCGQSEPALGKADLLAEGRNRGAAGIDGFPGCIPVGLCQTKRLIASGDLCFRLLHTCAGHIEVRIGLGYRIRSVLRGLFECLVLPRELLHFLQRSTVLDLERIQIGLRRDGGGIGISQRRRVGAYLLGRRRNLLLESPLGSPGGFQPLRIVVLAVVAFRQLVVGGFQRTLVLIDGVLLQRQAALQCGKLCSKARGGALEALHTGSSQLELGLRFSDLLADGLDISGEVVRLQGQRHHKVAEGFTHRVSPAFAKRKTVRTGITVSGWATPHR